MCEAARWLCRRLALLEGTKGEEREKAEQKEEKKRSDEGWKRNERKKDGKKMERNENKGWKGDCMKMKTKIENMKRTRRNKGNNKRKSIFGLYSFIYSFVIQGSF